MKLRYLTAATLLIGASSAMPLAAQDSQSATPEATEIGYDTGDLAYNALTRGEAEAALTQLAQSRAELVEDPAWLLNHGSALEQLGRYSEARASYQAARDVRPRVELILANGEQSDSRRLALRALDRLDRLASR